MLSVITFGHTIKAAIIERRQHDSRHLYPAMIALHARARLPFDRLIRDLQAFRDQPRGKTRASRRVHVKSCFVDPGEWVLRRAN